jgi:hypothetical protein
MRRAFDTILSDRMDILLRPLFSVLNVPELKLKKPGWIRQPAPYTVFALVLLSYFLVTGKTSVLFFNFYGTC